MPGRSLKQRTWVILVIATLLLPLLAGCQPTSAPTQVPSPSAVPTAAPSPPPASPAATIILSVWHSWDAQEEAIIRAFLDAYQQQRPGVAVRLRQVPVERIVQEYEEAVLVGEGPDLMAGRSRWVGQLAERQAIAPLGDLLEEEYWEAFYPFALEGVQVGEDRYAVPYACETVALYYNRDFVAEPPTSTAAMLNLVATWPGEEQAGLAFPLSFYNTIGYLYAFGGGLLDDEGHAALDTAEARAWLAWLQEVQDSPGVVATENYGQADARFKGGSVAMVVNGSWALPDYLPTLGSERLGVALLPMLDQTQAWPTPFVGYNVLMVNPVRLVQHPQETLDLLRALGGASPQQALASELNVVPTWSQIDLSEAPLLAAFVQQAERGRPRQLVPPLEVFWEPLETLLYNVTSGRVPVDLALQEAQQQIEYVLYGEEGEVP